MSFKQNHCLGLFVYLFLVIIFCTITCTVSAGTGSLPMVKEVDLNKIDPGLFDESEWYVPYYLKYLARVANSVVDSGDNYGYFGISVWRGRNQHHTYNARIMEGILSLVWFYTKDRPWNLYYNDPALGARIEAALTFWCNSQKPNGLFTEYSDTGHGFASTLFAEKFIGRSLWLLNRGPNIDKKIFNRSCNALRKAIYLSLTSDIFWRHGRSYTNQYANAWGGTMMYLQIRPDHELADLLKKRFNQSMHEFQSPAGFFYERASTDWGYNLSTHHSDLLVAWEFGRNTEFQQGITEKVRRWYDWFSYNAVKEPGTQCFFLNRAIEARQRRAYYIETSVKDPASERWTPQAEFVQTARAFVPDRRQIRDTIKEHYRLMRASYPKVRAFRSGSFNAFSPYAFLHDSMVRWFPTEIQKKQAIADLPYLKSDNFIHIRRDNRSNTEYSFIRKPGYYAVFNTGKVVSSQQRYGLGLVWNPVLGTVLQSQTGSDRAAWGTRSLNNKHVYEAGSINAAFKLDKKPWIVQHGLNNLQNNTLEISYALGKNGTKTVVFDGDKINVRIRHKGKFIEVLPVLKRKSDILTCNNNQIKLCSKNASVVIKCRNSSAINKSSFKKMLYNKTCQVFEVSGDDDLEYTIERANGCSPVHD